MIKEDRGAIAVTPDDDKISSFQLGVFIYNTILGVGILFLPASLTKAVENDGWILCIISGLINFIFIYFMCKVGEKYTREGFVGTLKKLFGGAAGILLALPAFIYFVLFESFEIRLFAEIVNQYLLPNTPIEFIIIPLFIVTIFLARSGVEPAARFFETVTPLIILVLIILILVTLPKSDYSNIRPLFATPVIKFIKGINKSIFAYSGFEILIIIFPYLRTPKKAFKAASIALTSIIILYTIITIQCLARFGTRETQALIYPTMSLMRVSEIPGGFIERVEGLLLALWVLFVYTTLVSVMFALSVIGGDILNHRNRKHIISLSLPFIYLISLSGQSIAEVFDLTDKMEMTFGIYTLVILPVIMFFAYLIKRKGEHQNES